MQPPGSLTDTRAAAVSACIALGLLVGVGFGIVVLRILLESSLESMASGLEGECVEPVATECVFAAGFASIFAMIGGILQFMPIALPSTIASVTLLVLGIRRLLKIYRGPAPTPAKFSAAVDAQGLILLGLGVTLLGPLITLLLLFGAPDLVI